MRIDRLSAEGTLVVGASRESMFLVNNLLFVLFTFTVLTGTTFPLIVEALRDVQMSVGRPYFDRMAVPVGVSLLLLMGVGPALPWGRATGDQVRRALLAPTGGGLAAAAIAYALGVRTPWTLATLAFAGFTAFVTLREVSRPLRRRMSAHGEGFGQALLESQVRRGHRRTGAYVVHAGAVIAFSAIAVSSTMGTSKEVQLKAGESTTLGKYKLTFTKVERITEPHRAALVARVAISRDGRDLGVLSPGMNQYENQREPVGTPDVRTSLFEDLYLSALNIDPEGGTLGLHAMINPMVGWIWAAAAIMALGGLVALVPARRLAPRTQVEPGVAAVAAQG
jgi:cytochrome c-type biogenesis protein CcmF